MTKFIFASIMGMYGVMTVVLMAIGAIIQGWVLSILWEWFMVPVFHLPPLAIAPAIGIALMIGLLTREMPRPVAEQKEPRPVVEPNAPRPKIEKMEREHWEKLGRFVVMPCLYPFITLFLGWVVHLFM